VASYLKIKAMKTNEQNQQQIHPSNGEIKREESNQYKRNRIITEKKPVYIKDMPPIDGARIGII
jgi:hypothetical protein